MKLSFSWNRPKGERARPWCSVIVPAAGNASRMEGTDKILTPLGGRPVLMHTLCALQACPYVDEIIVVAREDLMAPIGREVRAWNCTKVSRIVRGGRTRMESVWIGLGRVDERARLIGIHDGARPFVSQQVLEEVFRAAAKTGAAAPAVPVKDTVKRVDDRGCVAETVERSALRAVQTPQVFEADLIRAALQQAREQKLELTDDCSAVEAMGMKVLLTRGSYENIKITTPVDLVLGEAILQCQSE